MIPEATFAALDWLTVAFNLASEDVLNSQFATAEAMVNGHDPTTDLRIWWHRSFGNGLSHWISINPGEFRTEPPPVPCLVRELKEGAAMLSLRQAVGDAVSTARILGAIQDSERASLARAEAVLARPTPDKIPKDLYAMLRSANFADQSSYSTFMDTVRRQHFEGMSLTFRAWSDALHLFQLQHETGFFLEQDWQETPGAALQTFIDLLLSGDEVRRRCLPILMLRVEADFESGRDMIRQALSGGMAAMPIRLAYAWSQYWRAHSVVVGMARNGVDPLPIDPIVSEEAWVCTNSGVIGGARHLTLRPDTLALHLRTSHTNSLRELRRMMRRCASEIEPSYSIGFAEILAAQALAQASDPGIVSAGDARLKELESQVDPLSFEEDWISYARLDAARRLGDEGLVSAMTARLAGRLLMRKALSG